MVAVIQLSIALGSTAGGLVFDSLGWRSAFWFKWFVTSGSGSDDMCHIPSKQEGAVAQSFYFWRTLFKASG